MPKLLQINVTSNWGSTGKIAEQIGTCAQKSGWESYIAYNRRASKSSSLLIKIGSKYDMYTHAIIARLFDAAGLGSWFATKRFLKEVKRINPDVVHLHNIHGYVLNYKLLFEYLNKRDIPVVWTFHDFWAITGHCSHFVGASCERWQNGCHDCPLYKNYPSSITDFSKRNYALKKRLFTASDLHVVAVSKWVEQLTKLSFLKNKDIRNIDNGIDMSIFKPTPSYQHPSIDADKYVIIGVATQWGAGKGLNDYKKLASMLSDDELIVLVGMDENQIAQLPPKIIGIKRTSTQQELAALYSRADVVAILSQAETFGLTAIEGYACGTPAIVYDNTALPLLVRPETGRVVPTEDVETLYSTIQEFKKTKFKPQHSDDCIQYARENFDKDKCFEKYIDLYESLLR